MVEGQDGDRANSDVFAAVLAMVLDDVVGGGGQYEDSEELQGVVAVDVDVEDDAHGQGVEAAGEGGGEVGDYVG